MWKVTLGIVNRGPGYFKICLVSFYGSDRGELKCLVKFDVSLTWLTEVSIQKDKYASVSDVFSISISPFQAHGKAQFLEAPSLIKYLNLPFLKFQVPKNLMFFK